MLPLLFVLVAGVAGAPLSPEMPCLSKCFEESSLVAAANDLSNFRAISEGLEAFCGVNADLLRCGRECPEAEVHELEKRTSASSYICMEKAEEFRLISDCIKSKKDSVGRCAIDCQLDQQEAPLRFDSAPSALINPTVLLDSIKPNCNKHMCVVRCSIAALNGDCAGAGDLFKDLARHQVMAGVSRMEAESTGSDEMTKQLVLTYLNKLDTECPVMKDVHAFDKETAPGNTAGDSNAGSEMMTASMEKSTEKPELTTAGAEKEEEEKKEEKAEEEASGETTDATPEETTFEFEPVNEPEVPVGPPSESASTDAEVEPVTQAEIDEKIITNVHRETERPTVDDSALLTTERAEESTAKPEEKEEEKEEEEKEETTEAAEAIAAVENSDEHKGVDSDGFDITVSTQSTVESKEEPKEEEPKEEEPKEEKPKEEEPKEEEPKEEEPKKEEPKEEEPKEEEKEGETVISEEAEPKEEESSDAAAGTTEAPVAETTPAEPVIVVNDEESKEVESNKVHPGLFEPHKANSVSTIAASALMAVAVFAAF